MNLRWLVLVGIVVVGVGALGIRVCADGGAMASAYRSCDCLGLEWELRDRTAVDGPRRTLCLGWIRGRTCHPFRGGPEVPCDEARVEEGGEEGEELRLQYRISRDAVRPSSFVAITDQGMSAPLELVWDLPRLEDTTERMVQIVAQREFEVLIRELEIQGPNGVEFRTVGVLEPDMRLRILAVPWLTDEGRQRIAEHRPR
jgi:hypothetical protein